VSFGEYAVESEIPRGRQARAVWGSLSPQAREAAFAAARRGVAPEDVGVAWAAAGYGRLVSRRLRIVSLLAPLGIVTVAVVIGAVFVVAGARLTAIDAAMGVIVLGTTAGLLGLNLWARRFQRLYSSGLLGVEASRLGPPGTTSAPSMWAAGESEFTVPYQAQVPLAHPAPTVVADPAAAGVREIPVRRTRIVRSLTFLSTLVLLLWFTAVTEWAAPVRPSLASLMLISVATLGITAVLIFLLYTVTPALLRPVVARFTPDGWEVPQLRISGSWAEVRSIRVRPLAARGTTARTPQLAAIRMVALMVDNPQDRIAHLGPLRRAMARSSIAKYGSPAAFVAGPGRTITVVDLVRLLQRYTAAPVDRM
jgi:hypothetical protein